MRPYSHMSATTSSMYNRHWNQLWQHTLRLAAHTFTMWWKMFHPSFVVQPSLLKELNHPIFLYLPLHFRPMGGVSHSFMPYTTPLPSFPLFLVSADCLTLSTTNPHPNYNIGHPLWSYQMPATHLPKVQRWPVFGHFVLRITFCSPLQSPFGQEGERFP